MEENKILEAVTSLCNEMKAALAACDTNINRSADLKDLFGPCGHSSLNSLNNLVSKYYKIEREQRFKK